MRKMLYGMVVAVACSGGSGTDYYPMAVDNHWRYEVRNLTPGSGDDSRTILDTLGVTVTASFPSDASGRTLYRVVEEGLAPLWWIADTAYIEPTPDSVIVYDSLGSKPASLLLLLPAEPDRSWIHWAAFDTVRATIRPAQEVKVNAGTFASCIRVDFTPVNAAGWVYTAWFASGVGPVRYDYRSGIGSADSIVHRWALIDYAVGGR